MNEINHECTLLLIEIVQFERRRCYHNIYTFALLAVLFKKKTRDGNARKQLKAQLVSCSLMGILGRIIKTGPHIVWMIFGL